MSYDPCTREKEQINGLVSARMLLTFGKPPVTGWNIDLYVWTTDGLEHADPRTRHQYFHRGTGAWGGARLNTRVLSKKRAW